MRFGRHSSRREVGAVAASTLALLAAMGSGCTTYNQDVHATRSIYDVRVTTRANDVAGCRLIERVDSRDPAKGCGLTVQPTPEECLRYQVRRAGGDTLLMRGPVGEAFDCAGQGVPPPPTAAAEATPVSAPSRPAATIVPTPAPTAPSAPPEPTPAAPAPPVPPAPPSQPPSAARVRITDDREAAKGCVYLGDATSGAKCPEASGEASGDCAEQALKAGGDLILRDGNRSQIFSCKARP